MPDVLSTADTTVSSGVFNRPITIQKRTDTKDSMGGATRTWSNYIKTMAHIEPIGGAERPVAQQLYANNRSKFLIRYRPSQNIDASMRILYRSRIYNIRNITQLAEAHTTLQIVAEEQQAKGSL
jgi:SPP1 family predicted phage head-tail adaptor